MAEAGDRDDNLIGPGGRVPKSINRTPEWRMERARMLRHIVDCTMESMSQEEKEGRARASVCERWILCPDHELVDKFEKLNGEWSDELEYYRPLEGVLDCKTKKD